MPLRTYSRFAKDLNLLSAITCEVVDVNSCNGVFNETGGLCGCCPRCEPYKCKWSRVFFGGRHSLQEQGPQTFVCACSQTAW